MTIARKHLGAAGERLAARAYVDAGFEVIATNWRCAEGEIDLIAGLEERLLVFCEVKTRRGVRFGSGLDAVGPEKQRRLRTLAMTWLASHPDFRGYHLRLDVAAVDVSVSPIEVVIVPSAF